MNIRHLIRSSLFMIIFFVFPSILAVAQTCEKTTLAGIGKCEAELVEVTGIPLVSTFKEDDGYGVWNLLLGQDDQKLLCYEDGNNLDPLRSTHEDIRAIIEKNEDFKKEGLELQSITVRGSYDSDNEILNMAEIIYAKGTTEYRVITDEGESEAEEYGGEGEYDQSEVPAETYIIFHEVGQPWLYAPAWWHYPSWWGGMWVDMHWWWRPWYDCGLGWYYDHYCYDWNHGHHHDPYGGSYADGGRSYRQYDRRRGMQRESGERYSDRRGLNEQGDRHYSKDFRAPNRPARTDGRPGIRMQQPTHRSIDTYQRSSRSGTAHTPPTVKSQPRTYSRSTPPSHQPSRGSSSAPSHSTPSRTRARR